MTDINSLLAKFASARLKQSSPGGVYPAGTMQNIPLSEMSARNLLPFGMASGDQEGFNLGEILGSGALGYVLPKILTESTRPGGLFRGGSYLYPRGSRFQNIANLKPGPAQNLMARYLRGPAASISVTPTVPGGVLQPPITIGGKNFPATAAGRAALLMRPPQQAAGRDPRIDRNQGPPVQSRYPYFPGLPGGRGVIPGTTLAERFFSNAPGAKVEMALPAKAFEGAMGLLSRGARVLSDPTMPSPAIRPRTLLGGARTLLPSRLGGVRSSPQTGGLVGTLVGLGAPLAYNYFTGGDRSGYSGHLSSLNSQQNLSGQPIIPQ